MGREDENVPSRWPSVRLRRLGADVPGRALAGGAGTVEAITDDLIAAARSAAPDGPRRRLAAYAAPGRTLGRHGGRGLRRRAGGGCEHDVMASRAAADPAGRDRRGSELPGPFPVGELRRGAARRGCASSRACRCSARCRISASRAKAVYFELRDDRGALPCSMWRDDFDALGRRAAGDGAQVVVAGGCDYYPGSAHVLAARSRSARPACAWPARATCSRSSSACAAARTPRACSSRRSSCRRPALPRSIGVVTGEGGKARDDVLAGLRRRGWAGRLVWGFAPVQDRHAAPRDRPRAPGPGGGRRGRRDRRRARRRLAGRPVRLLRRDALPHRRAAARPGDRLGRPPHRSHADRRRRRRRLLDADPRRRDGRPRRLRPGARRRARRRPAPRAPRPPRARRPRPRTSPRSRARRTSTSPASAPGCTRRHASCAPPAPASSQPAPSTPPATASSSSARPRPPSRSPSRCSPAATPSSRTPTGELVTSAEAARKLRDLTVRFHDAAVRARIEEE